jgi:DNA-binding response OmpR family regulator
MHIALLASDPEQRAQLAAMFSASGMATRLCPHRTDLHKLFEANPCALLVAVLADLGSDVAGAVRELRTLPGAQAIPILLLGERRDEDELVSALQAGADDYLLMPLRRAEVVARARILLKRTYPERFAQTEVSFGSYSFDPSALRVATGGATVDLTRKEFELALLLFRNVGRPLSRTYMLDVLWPEDAVQVTRTLDTHVSRVRNKLGLRPENGYRLNPVYGYGYLLEALQMPD